MNKTNLGTTQSAMVWLKKNEKNNKNQQNLWKLSDWKVYFASSTGNEIL